MVRVRLFTNLPAISFSGRGHFEIVWSPGLRVETILSSEGLSTENLGIILVNGRHASPDTQLQDGDSLALFAPAGGG